jgi:hypothetical protein
MIIPGLTTNLKYLLIGSIAAGGIGALVNAVMLDTPFSAMPELKIENDARTFWERVRDFCQLRSVKGFKLNPQSVQKRFWWLLSRTMLGVVAGTLIFLFSLGSVKNNVEATGKILIAAFVAGLTAPSFIKQLEKHHIDK